MNQMKWNGINVNIYELITFVFVDSNNNHYTVSFHEMLKCAINVYIIYRNYLFAFYCVLLILHVFSISTVGRLSFNFINFRDGFGHGKSVKIQLKQINVQYKGNAIAENKMHCT